MNIFLKARHWQLFLLLIVFPLVSYLYTFSLMLWPQTLPEAVNHSNSRGFEQVLGEKFIELGYHPYILMVVFLLYLEWFWSVGTGLQNVIPKNIRASAGGFKFCIVFLVTLIIVRKIILPQTLLTKQEYILQNIEVVMTAFLTYRLLLLSCLLYASYFIAKALKIAELKSEVGGADFIVELVLILLFPIGIWFIQPRLNIIYKNSRSA